jgi:indole-3-glycerol phosphate synthase
MGDKLSEIMAAKAKEIGPKIRPVRESELIRLGGMKHRSPGFLDALRQIPSHQLGIIAEIKRKSPSAGVIKDIPSAEEQARLYLNAGATCLSVLTDLPYFGGTLQDLWEVTEFIDRHQRNLPCLRKDFMLHPIQVVEAAEAGARAILIIVRALDDDTINELYEAANLAGLDALFEIHTEAELERSLRFNPRIIGVNNRDLARFTTDLGLSEKIIPQIPKDILAVSESGIRTGEDAGRMLAAGARALLVGETLMRAEDPEAALRELQSPGE